MVVNCQTVSAAYDDCFYVETPNRVCGLRVNWTGGQVSRDRLVTVSGTMATTAAGERFIAATNVMDRGTGSVSTLAMSSRSVGAGQGLSTTGLLVTVFGKCVGVDLLPNPTNLLCPFWIDDGCGVDGGTRYDTGELVTGLRVYYGLSTAPYTPGDYLLVTGVAGVEINDPTPEQPASGDERVIRVIYVRSDADVVNLGAQ